MVKVRDEKQVDEPLVLNQKHSQMHHIHANSALRNWTDYDGRDVMSNFDNIKDQSYHMHVMEDQICFGGKV